MAKLYRERLSNTYRSLLLQLCYSIIIALLFAACAQEVTPPNTAQDPGNTGPNLPGLPGAQPSVCNSEGALSVTNLAVPNSVSQYAYEVGQLSNSAQVYVDRPGQTFGTNIPTSLQGITHIRTANDDKQTAVGSNNFLSFEVNKAVDVYVALDTRVSLPSWMNGWENTQISFPVFSDTTWALYKKTYNLQPCGGIQLGSNGSANGNSSMYGVFVVEQGSINPDVLAIFAQADQGYSTNQGSPVSIPVLDNDVIPASISVGVSIDRNPENGTAVVNSDNSITYSPQATFTGTDNFQYRITGDQGQFSVANVYVQVICANCAVGVNVTLNWNANANSEVVYQYRVYSRLSNESTMTLHEVVNVNQTGFDPNNPSRVYDAGGDLNLASGDVVCFSLSAANVAGESGLSTPQCSSPIP